MKTSHIINAAQAIQQAILNNESTLESLDREIGDGDHFINMKRGANTIVEMQAELATLTPDAALNKIGMKLLSTIGGASGPLLASFFMSMGKTLKENGDDSQLKIAAAFAAGVQAIIQRGKADIGEKTMLDVLIPVSNQLVLLAAQNCETQKICTSLTSVAEAGMLSTKNLIATKGRAAGLGERAIGHIDPGAKSCQLMVEAVCKRILLEA
ncbi:MAG: dihydroxyacetone kinase subunit L [Methylotenera sp.]|nr:dihydroxyacetone kinase subunit L [Methylotenera sp.]